MRYLKKGATILELLIYAGLLSIFATLVFSLVWQVHKKNQKNLMAHANLNAIQIALDLLVRDLRQSELIELKRNNQLNLACKMDLGVVQWKLEGQTLLRIDHQTKLKKPAASKVAEDITKVSFLRIENKLIRILVASKNNASKMKRVVLLRREINI